MAGSDTLLHSVEGTISALESCGGVQIGVNGVVVQGLSGSRATALIPVAVSWVALVLTLQVEPGLVGLTIALLQIVLGAMVGMWMLSRYRQRWVHISQGVVRVLEGSLVVLECDLADCLMSWETGFLVVADSVGHQALVPMDATRGQHLERLIVLLASSTGPERPAHLASEAHGLLASLRKRVDR